jgi:hypothetical protein
MRIAQMNNTNPSSRAKNQNFKANLKVTEKAGKIIGNNIRNYVKAKGLSVEQGAAGANFVDYQLSVLATHLRQIPPFDYNVTLGASQAYKRHEARYGTGANFDNEAQGDLEFYFEGAPRSADFTLNLPHVEMHVERLFHAVADRIQNPEKY